MTSLQIFLHSSTDYTLKDALFLTALRFVLFCGYFILYNKHLKAKSPDADGSVKGQLVDIFLYPDVLYRADLSGQLLLFGFSRRHTQLSGIADDMHTDAVSLYSDILYLSNGRRCDGKRADCREYERADPAAEKAVRILSAKKRGREDFRHDARHRDSILISYLENGEVEGAKEF